MRRPRCGRRRGGSSMRAAARGRSARSWSGCCGRAASGTPSSKSSRRRVGNDRAEVRARRGRIVYRLLVVLSAIVQRLPLGVARACGVALGHVAWHVVQRERRLAMSNLAQAFPDWTKRQRSAITRAMFHHLGRIVFEMLWLPRFDAATRERTTEVVGLEPFREVLRRGKGAIAITAHHGNR